MFSTNRIREIRLENNMSQKDISQILGVTRSSYAMWESNNNIIPLKRLIVLADYYKVNLDYLLGFRNRVCSVKSGYDLMLCSKRLKEFRKEHNLTQQQIAAFLHIDQPTWSIYENGKNLIGTPFLYMICNKYKISADYLLGRIDEPKYLK